MAAIRTIATSFFQSSSFSTFVRTCSTHGPRIRPPICFITRPISYAPIRCAATSDSGGGGHKKASARMSQVHQLLHEAEERAAGHNEPIPTITLGIT